MSKNLISRLKVIYENVMDNKIDENEFIEGNLIEKFNIDSLIALQIIVEIEKSFGIVIEDDDEAVKIVDFPSNFLSTYQEADKNEQSYR